MIDDSEISTKTWARNVDAIKKDGYSDGALDGMNATYQSSFDMGYSQGLEFGLKLGLSEAIKRTKINHNEQLSDARRINCQICIGNDMQRKDIGDLFNIQKEQNDAYLEKLGA